MAWMGLYKSDDEKRADAAAAAKVAQDKLAAIDFANYRQTSRNEYQRQRNNEYAQYSPVNQILMAGGGPGMAGPSSGPVSLADTGVGAPAGSNYAGWDEDNHSANGPNGNFRGTRIHHAGIAETQLGQESPLLGDSGHTTAGMQARPGYYVEGAVTGENGGFGGGSKRYFKVSQGQSMDGGADVAATPSAQFAPMQPGAAPAAAPSYSFFPGRR